MTEFDVTCGPGELDEGSTGAIAKLSSTIAEVNVWFTAAEARNVRKILALKAGAAGIPLGRSARSQVFWARDADDRFYLLVGEGDTTWDIGFTLPISTVRSVIQGVAAACGYEAS